MAKWQFSGILRIALYYAIFGSLWIYASDTILDKYVSDPIQRLHIQTYKGWIFVLGSTVFIFLLLKRELYKQVQINKERQKANDALRESEEQFRQIAENIRQVFWMTDPQKQQMLYVSPAYEEIWGHSRESLYANPIFFLEAILPEDRDRVTAALAKQINDDYDEEYRILHPDGTMRLGEQDMARHIEGVWGILDKPLGLDKTAQMVYEALHTLQK